MELTNLQHISDLRTSANISEFLNQKHGAEQERYSLKKYLLQSEK